MAIPGARTTPCRECGKPIMFVHMAGRSKMPVDPDIDTAGNVAVYRAASGAFIGRVVTKDRPDTEAGERLFMSHFATCTARKQDVSRETSGPLADEVIDLFGRH